MKVRELIEQLKKLPLESEVFVTQWFKRNSNVMPYAAALLQVKRVKEIIHQDTNKKMFYLETNPKELEQWQTGQDQSK